MAKSGDIARRLVTAVVIAAMFWPLVSNDDGLPLSTYPMYSGTRSETLTFITASGIDAAGVRTQLSMTQIAQTRDPLIAQSFLNDAASLGTIESVCEDIASRLGPGPVRGVEVAREVHNVTAFARDRESLVSRRVLADCAVTP